VLMNVMPGSLCGASNSEVSISRVSKFQPLEDQLFGYQVFLSLAFECE
jgi:hypothetical protein